MMYSPILFIIVGGGAIAPLPPGSTPLECILHFGMLCLSAGRMMFVIMVFAVCISGGG